MGHTIDRCITTGDSVRNRSDSEAHLISFWPQGAIKPFVFCDMIGKEAVNYTGQEGTARVGLESKYNEKEAKKIVTSDIHECPILFHFDIIIISCRSKLPKG